MRNKIIYKILIILGIIGILDFIFLLIIKSVFNFGTIFPAVVGVIICIYGVGKLKNDNFFKINNSSLRAVVKTVIVVFLISFIVIEARIFGSLKKDSTSDVDYLVILGAGIKGNKITLTLKNRLDKGIEYLIKNPTVEVVVTGGKGIGETITEAEAMKKYLVEKGIESKRIIKEEKATSTMENFKYTNDIIKENIKNPYKIMIVTSEFHMFRAKMLAKRNGFIPYGMPSKTVIYILPNCLIREYFALIKSFVFDR